MQFWKRVWIKLNFSKVNLSINYTEIAKCLALLVNNLAVVLRFQNRISIISVKIINELYLFEKLAKNRHKKITNFLKAKNYGWNSTKQQIKRNVKFADGQKFDKFTKKYNGVFHKITYELLKIILRQGWLNKLKFSLTILHPNFNSNCKKFVTSFANSYQGIAFTKLITDF